eukprot:CAMPEP_0172709708 /NCGR_PEP_ID=MMETSP1074-20121228/55227_1 /TAXON_ID=2916 /ORGANISM="Ceratium fusus, Strain PA161109" /LENGTH=134 /DNA_ID=CAMNT_0013533007 /DNA_START=65 /DNA_END=469 /DNA_ORIENTATION=-
MTLVCSPCFLRLFMFSIACMPSIAVRPSHMVATLEPPKSKTCAKESHEIFKKVMGQGNADKMSNLCSLRSQLGLGMPAEEAFRSRQQFDWLADSCRIPLSNWWKDRSTSFNQKKQWAARFNKKLRELVCDQEQE